MRLIKIGFPVFLAAACFGLPARAGVFKAACVRLNITPDRPVRLYGYSMRNHVSEGVHDSLFMKVLCLDDGDRRFFLVSSDLGVAPANEGFFSRLKKEAGVERECLMWTATHSHSAPTMGQENGDYADRVRDQCLRGILQAKSALAPAKLGYTVGIALAGLNRRAKYPDTTRLGKNPKGPMDRDLGIIKIERMDGSPMAMVANHAVHGTALFATNYRISGDAPGIAEAYVEKKLGAPVLFVNGACGNIDPLFATVDSFAMGNHFDIAWFEQLLGEPIWVAQSMVETSADVRLRTARVVIDLPRDPRKPPRNSAPPGPVIPVSVQFLSINGLIIFAAPLEMFCDIAMDIKEHSPFDRTFFFGYCNGSLGYLPTRNAYPKGGYEIGVTPFLDTAEAVFRERVLAEIVKQYRKTTPGESPEKY